MKIKTNKLPISDDLENKDYKMNSKDYIQHYYLLK